MPPNDPTSKACLSVEALGEWVAGRTSDESLRRHIESCPVCSHEVTRLRGDDVFLDEFKSVFSVSPIRPPRVETIAGDQLPGYEILEEISRGGQGVVYRAVQQSTRRRVAVKIIDSSRSMSLRQQRRFEREIEIVASLRHPNIVTVFDSGVTADGRLFFAMEYVSSQTLDAYLAEHQPKLAERLRLMETIARALNYAHLRGVIHRDLKPSNILVDMDGHPHVIDFGLAKLLVSSDDREAALSRSGEFAGTLPYASPEQVRGHSDDLDSRTDVYSLGLLLYEVVCGRPPYILAGSLAEMVRTIVEELPVRPSSVRSDLNPELDTIVQTALAKDPGRRYQTAGALANDIDRYLTGRPIDAKRDSTWYLLSHMARRYRVHTAIAASFLLFMVAFAFTLFIQNRRIVYQRDRAVAAEKLTSEHAEELSVALARSNIEQGRALVRAGDIVPAEDLMWPELFSPPPAEIRRPRSPEDSAAAYWALWDLYRSSPCLATFEQSHALGDLAFSPDSRLLYSVGSSGTLAVRDIESRKVVKTLEHLVGQYGSALELSPSGKLLIVYSADTPTQIWETDTWSRVGELPSFHNVCFSADESTLASTTPAGIVSLWDLHTLTHLRDIGHSPLVMLSVTFLPDGKSVAWTSGPTVDIWNGTEVRTSAPIGIHPQRICTKVLAEQDGMAVVVMNSGQAYRWKAPFDEPPRFLLGDGGQHGGGMAMSPDENLLATSGTSTGVDLWEMGTGQRITSWGGHRGTVATPCFSPDGKLLVSSSSDRTARVWDLAHTRCVSSTSFPRALTVHALAYAPDGRTLAIGGGDGTGQFAYLGLKNPAGGELQEFGSAPKAELSGVEFGPDGRLLITAAYDGTLQLWDVPTLRAMNKWEGHDGQIHAVHFSPDGGTIASAGRDRLIRLWDTLSQECTGILHGHADRVPQLAFSPDGEKLASSGCADRSVIVWTLAEGIPATVLKDHPATVRAVAWSPQGDVLASGADDFIIRLWDPDTGTLLAEMPGHSQNIFSLAFSLNGEHLASGTRAGEVRLWDVQSRRNLLVLDEPSSTDVFALRFSPNGRELAVGGGGSYLKLWDLTYFKRHIAGNLEYQLNRYSAEFSEPRGAAELVRWADQAFSLPSILPAHEDASLARTTPVDLIAP